MDVTLDDIVVHQAVDNVGTFSVSRAKDLSSCVGVLRVKPVFLNLMCGFLPSWILVFVIAYWRDNASSSSAITRYGSTKDCSCARSISAALSRCQRSRSIR